MTSWMTLSWYDTRLSWTPSDYDDIKTLHVHIDYLWCPELYLYNSHLATGSGKCQPDVDCLIFSDSRVACVMPCEHTGHCILDDYSNWPFDKQNCSYIMGSWTKLGEEVNYNSEKVKVISSRIKENNRWRLLAAEATVKNDALENEPNATYPYIFFTFLIERHSAFHVSGTIIPAIVLSIFNLTILWMDSRFVSRLVVNMFALYSHSLYLEFLYWA